MIKGVAKYFSHCGFPPKRRFWRHCVILTSIGCIFFNCELSSLVLLYLSTYKYLAGLAIDLNWGISIVDLQFQLGRYTYQSKFCRKSQFRNHDNDRRRSSLQGLQSSDDRFFKNFIDRSVFWWIARTIGPRNRNERKEMNDIMLHHSIGQTTHHHIVWFVEIGLALSRKIMSTSHPM